MSDDKRIQEKRDTATEYLKYNAEGSILQAALQDIRPHFQADLTERA